MGALAQMARAQIDIKIYFIELSPNIILAYGYGSRLFLYPTFIQEEEEVVLPPFAT
jgi:hypothetical protein